MTVSLTPKLERLIREKVDSGMYHSPTEVVGEALRLLDARDHLQEIKLDALRRDIQEGLSSGESSPLDVEGIKAEGRSRLAQRNRKIRR